MDLDQHRRVASESATPSRDEVEDEDDDSEHQQKMNQTTGYVEGEAQKPQNQYDDKDCPEHKSPNLRIAGARELESRSGACNAVTNGC
jgi:hypothetical protein